mgnify:FL=1
MTRLAGRLTVIGFWTLLVTAVGWRHAAGGGLRDEVPADVVERALVARANMQAIVQAVFIYMNDNFDQPPPTLAALYPTLISDPLVFWHPGDSDPPPTTIDNDVPNAPNSARISFDIDLSTFRNGGCWGEVPWIRDNSPANNGGWFATELMADGEWYTMPPDRMPTPSYTSVAAHHLRALVGALHVYANDNRDWWPTDPLQLLWYIGPPCGPARSFWHPGDDQPMPTQITNSALNAPDSVQISFEYLVAGLNDHHPDPNLPFFRDNSPANNGGCGRLVALRSGPVIFEWQCPGDLTGDGAVDLADFERLAAHMGAARQICDGDYDLSGGVDLADVAYLQQRFGAVCE